MRGRDGETKTRCGITQSLSFSGRGSVLPVPRSADQRFRRPAAPCPQWAGMGGDGCDVRISLSDERDAMTTRVSAVVFLLTGLIAGMMAATLDTAWAGKVKFATLTTPGEQVIAWFGWSIQSVGDLNGDAAVDWAVSAPQQTVDGVGQQGAVLIFSGRDNLLLFTLRDPVPGAQATFGEAISPVDDVNGDGVADLVAGARLQDVGGNDGQGQAYVFSGVDGAWLGVTLAAPVPQASAFFGASLATIGDRNQDGRSDVVVGAPQQSFGEIDSEGAAYLMSPATGELLAVIMHPSPQAGASFGFAVESVGDLDGDSVFDFVISAPFQAVSGNISQGQVYAFSGQNTQLLYTVNAPESLPSGRLGFAVTAIGDVNDDGVDDLVVGAPTADVPALRNQGRVFIVSGADGTVLHTLSDPTPLENGLFGAALASPGDIDGDGIDDVAVGSPAPRKRFHGHHPSRRGAALQRGQRRTFTDGG